MHRWLLVVLLGSIGCVAHEPASPSARPAYKFDFAKQGVQVAVEGLRLQWAASLAKDPNGQESIQFALGERGTMGLTVYRADMRPDFAISMAHATLAMNGLTVSPIEPMAGGDIDLRFSFAGQSGEFGKMRGLARSWIVPSTSKTAFLYGFWQEALDASAAADFDAVFRGTRPQTP